MNQPISEREFLMKDSCPHQSGFAPRPVQKLVTRKIPRSSLNIECNHFLRNTSGQSAHGHDSVPFRLWLEAGKHQPPLPEKPDPNYNSNVWRNFQRQYGFHPDTKGQKIDQMIASMYPLNVPAPSTVGEYNYAKFLTETPIIRDEKLRKMAVDRTTKDLLEFRRLRLRSDSRNPPIDQSGQTLHIVGLFISFNHYKLSVLMLSAEFHNDHFKYWNKHVVNILSIIRVGVPYGRFCALFHYTISLFNTLHDRLYWGEYWEVIKLVRLLITVLLQYYFEISFDDLCAII